MAHNYGNVYGYIICGVYYGVGMPAKVKKNSHPVVCWVAAHCQLILCTITTAVTDGRGDSVLLPWWLDYHGRYWWEGWLSFTTTWWLGCQGRCTAIIEGRGTWLSMATTWLPWQIPSSNWREGWLNITTTWWLGYHGRYTGYKRIRVEHLSNKPWSNASLRIQIL